MRLRTVAALTGLLAVASVSAAQEEFPELSQHVPYLTQRLHDSRWQVRYGLLGELPRRSPETKRVIEMLLQDEHEQVAFPAAWRYFLQYVDVDKSLFRPAVLTRGAFPTEDLPSENPQRALVDHCLGRRKILLPERFRRNSRFEGAVVAVLNKKNRDDAQIYNALTIVGLLGEPVDAKALYPYLDSENRFVALSAARAVIRLGDREKGRATLLRLAKSRSLENLYQTTEALHALHELGQPELEELVRSQLALTDRVERIQSNSLNLFLSLAADVLGDEVWRPKGPATPPDTDAQ